MLFGQPGHAFRGLDHLPRLRQLELGEKVQLQGDVEDGVLGRQVGALLRHQPGALVVDHEPVVNAFHPVRHAADDRRGVVQVGRHVGVPVRGGLDRSADLLRRVLDGIDRVMGGTHATGGHDLDLGGAVPQVFADAGQHRRHPVGQPEEAKLLRIAGGPDPQRVGIGGAAEITVPPGLRDERAGREDPGAVHQPVLDGLAQTEHRPAQVTDRGETAHQHVAAAPGHDMGQVVPVEVVHGLGAADDRQVHVGVDEARQQHVALTVDDGPGFGRSTGLSHRHDAVSFDEHRHVFNQARLAGVEQVHVRDQRRRHPGRRAGQRQHHAKSDPTECFGPAVHATAWYPLKPRGRRSMAAITLSAPVKNQPPGQEVHKVTMRLHNLNGRKFGELAK